MGACVYGLTCTQLLCIHVCWGKGGTDLIKYFSGKNRITVIGGVAALLVMIALGASWSFGRAQQDTMIGYIDSDRLVKEFVEPMVMEPLSQETDRLQKELDAEIAKLPDGDENKKLEEAQALLNKHQAVLDQKKQELISPLLGQIKVSIEKVAQARGITLVLDNTYGLVVYGGVDLTDAILQDLAQDQ